MRRINRPDKTNIDGYGRNSPALIIPFLPDRDCFFDSRHWTFCYTDEELPFAVTTRISENNQQFLKIYEKQQDNNDY